MAFSAPTTLGTGSSKAGTSLVVTLTAGTAAGNLVVVTIGCDNKVTTDVVGADDIVSVADSKGNTYTLARGQTNGQGAAQSGVAGTIWYSNIVTALAVNDTVTITNATTDYARAAYVAGYPVGAGNMGQVAGVASGVGDAGADPASVISGLTSGTYLYVGVSVDETTTGSAAYTGFTRLGLVASSGQAAASNIATSHQYAIDASSTGKTFTPATAVDAVSVLVGFREIVNPNAYAPVTTNLLTASVGDETVNFGSSVTETGEQITASVGDASVRVTASTTVTGQQLTAGVGDVTVSTVSTVTGPEWDTDGDTWDSDFIPWDQVTQEATVNVTGLQLTASVGTVTASIRDSVTVTGQQVSAQVGTVTVAAKATATLTGQQVTASVGTVSVTGKANITVTGQQATASVGTASAVLTANVYPTGQVLNALGGGVSVSNAGNMTVGVDGPTITASYGTVSIRGHANVTITDTATAPANWLMTSFTPSSVRNDYGSESGEVGGRIYMTADKTFEWIGMYAVAGNTGIHRLGVYEWFDLIPIRTATIDLTGKAPDQWHWVSVAPFTLTTGNYYAIVSGVTAYDGQDWLNQSPMTMTQPFIGNLYGAYRSSTVASFNGASPDAQFLGVDLGTGGAGGVLGLTVSAGTATVGLGKSTSVTGQQVAVSVGAVQVSTQQKITVTGQQIAASVGTVTASTKVNAAVTGQSLAVSTGTLSVVAKANVTVNGQSVSASAGTLSATGKANVTALTTVAFVSVGTANAVTVNRVPVTGQSVTASVGDVTVSGKATATLLGEQLTVEVGDVDYAVSVNVTVGSQWIAAYLGTVDISLGISFTVAGCEMQALTSDVFTAYDCRFELPYQTDAMTIHLGRATSPNWGHRPEDDIKDENWIPVDEGGHGNWVPVPTDKHVWVKTTSPEETWTKHPHDKHEWTHGKHVHH